MSFSIPTLKIPTAIPVEFPNSVTNFSFSTMLNTGALSNIRPPSTTALPATPAIPSVPGLPTLPTPPTIPAVPDVSGMISTVTNGVNSLMVNPAGAHLVEIKDMISKMPSLGQLGEMTGASKAFTAVTEMAEGAKVAIAAEMESLKTKLPVMSAASNIENAPKALSGVMPSIAPPALLEQATSMITSIGPIMENAKATIAAHVNTVLGAAVSAGFGSPTDTPHAKLAAFAAAVPPQTIVVDGIAQPNPAYATFQSTHTGTISSISTAAGSLHTPAVLNEDGSVKTPASGVIADVGDMLSKAQGAGKVAMDMGVSLLKDMAFAKFASSNQSAAVQNILAKFVSPPSATAQVERVHLSIGGLAQSKVNNEVTPAPYTTPARQTSIQDLRVTNPPNPPAVDAPADPVWKQMWSNAFDADVRTTIKLDRYAADNVAPRRKVLEKWKADTNYGAIKAAAVDNPSDADKQYAYNTLKAQLEASNGPDPAANYVEFERCRINLAGAIKAHEAGFAVLKDIYQHGMPAGKSIAVTEQTFGDFTVEVVNWVNV